MENLEKISCVIDTTDPTAELGLEIWLDDKQVFNSEHVTETINFDYLIDDSIDRESDLRFVMKNKTEKHTVIDENNEIVTDARLVIRDIMLSGIALGQIVTDLAVYTHNFNGTQEEVQDKFYSEMGCNGTVSLKFSTPIYLWLLETL